MPRHQEVNKLLHRLSDSTQMPQGAPRFEHYLLPDIDVSPYQRARAYPGTTFILMGNSFNLEESNDQQERSATLSQLFENPKEPLIKLSQALKLRTLDAVLSRFERDWLSRLPEDTQIGPAFDSNGKPISEAFAVWRSVQTVLNASKTLSPY